MSISVDELYQKLLDFERQYHDSDKRSEVGRFRFTEISFR